MKHKTSILSLVSVVLSGLLTNGCATRLWKPVTIDAPAYTARHAWNLRKDVLVVIVRTDGDSMFGQFQHVVSLNNPLVHYRMSKGVVSDSMQIELVGIGLETTRRSEVVPLEDVQSIVIPTGFEECGHGEIGCLSLRWDELWGASPCLSLSEHLSSDTTEAGFPAGKRYWPGEIVEEVNERAAKSKATVVLTGERERKAKHLILAADSSSWLDPKRKTLVRVASEEILAIRFTDHAEGAKRGVASGLWLVLETVLENSNQDDEERAWERILAPAAALEFMTLGGAIGGVVGVTTNYEPLLPCPQSL